jgi:2-C-methyl-D-erythritol 4-phosphate cytidylyltransferase
LTIKNCFETAGKFGNAIPVVSAVDSVRMVDNGQNRHIDRNTVKLVQTPQVFECRLIKEAYQQKYQTGFTDDTSVLESKAHKIYLVEGNGENIKITTQTDLLIAKALIRTINPE